MSKQKKVKAPERERSNSGNVMRAVATSIEFIKSQIVNDLLEAKNKNLINMIDKEIKALYDNPLMFTDHFNNIRHPGFRDNRHEQSVFSIIRKLHNPILIEDETFFIPFGSEESLNYPIWATRKN